VPNQFFFPAAIVTNQIVGGSVGFEQFVGYRTPFAELVLVQISKKVGARTRAPWEKGSHSPGKSGLNLNFAPDPAEQDAVSRQATVALEKRKRSTAVASETGRPGFLKTL
jgi:hypothetical protein